MNEYFNILRHKRSEFLDMTSRLTTAQYNFIPEGFNNNVIWNMGHVVTVSNRRLERENGFAPAGHKINLDLFARGTKPTFDFDDLEIKEIRQELIHSVDVYNEKAKSTSQGMTGTVASSLEFLVFHDNYHYLRVAELIKALTNYSSVI